MHLQHIIQVLLMVIILKKKMKNCCLLMILNNVKIVYTGADAPSTATVNDVWIGLSRACFNAPI